MIIHRQELRPRLGNLLAQMMGLPTPKFVAAPIEPIVATKSLRENESDIGFSTRFVAASYGVVHMAKSFCAIQPWS